MTFPVGGIDPHQDTFTVGIVDAREVPASRSAAQRRSRRLDKTDAVDAVSSARALQAEPTLGPAQALEVYDPLVAEIEAVLEHRRALVAARTLGLHHVGDQISKLPTEIRDQLTSTGKIESTSEATGASTACSTSPRSPRPDNSPTRPPTSPAKPPKARPGAKPAEPTNATSPTESSAECGATNRPANNPSPSPLDKGASDRPPRLADGRSFRRCWCRRRGVGCVVCGCSSRRWCGRGAARRCGVCRR